MNCKKIFPKDPIFDCKIILTFLWSLKTVKIATRGPQNIVWNTLQIDTLKYLEIRIKKWPSRANLGQVRSSGAKQGLTGKILTKCGQMEPNRPNGLIFLHAGILLWEEDIIFSIPGTQTKMSQAIGILLILRFISNSTETGVTFLVLLYHLKAYLHGFILSHEHFLLVAYMVGDQPWEGGWPSWVWWLTIHGTSTGLDFMS